MRAPRHVGDSSTCVNSGSSENMKRPSIAGPRLPCFAPATLHVHEQWVSK